MKRIVFAACLCCFVVGTVGLAAEFYVAPTGSAEGRGTQAEPFGTLNAAQTAIRQARKERTVKPDEPVTVYLLPGKYFLNDSFELGKEDSGTDFRSTTKFGAELIGGAEVPASAFKKVDDPAILNRLDSEAKDKILVADLDALNIPKTAEWAREFKGRPNAPPELFFNGDPMTIARWPNDGWAGFKTTLDSGMPHDDKTDEVNQKAAEKAKVDYKHPAVDSSRRHGGAFLYDEETLKLRAPDRIARWNVADGVWLCGYWTHDWADEVLKVASIDAATKILQIDGQHGYGIGGKSWTGYSERRYFAMNLLEELDAPGEWYLDRKANRLYFYPPKPLENATIILSTLDKPIVSIKNANAVRFYDVSFGPTFNVGVSMTGGTKNALFGCRVYDTGIHGVRMEGGTTNIVRGCDIFNIGAVGITMVGGDRRNLKAGDLQAINNHIHHFGRLQRTYAGAVGLQGVGNIVRNNTMHDAPHCAILYGGNENRIERNDIYNVVQETSDAGALYTGRDWTTQGNVIEENFIHHLGTSDSHGTMGVYLDDCDCGDTIRRNVFYKASRAVFIGGGRDNFVQNNVFIECYQGIALDSRGMTWKNWNVAGGGWNLEEKAEQLNYKNPPWSERYPKLAKIMENMPQAPLGCVFEKNVMIDCKQWINLDDNVLKLLARDDIEDNVVVFDNLVVENDVKSGDPKLPEKEKAEQKYLMNTDPGFVDVANNDFRFVPGSKLLDSLPKGFETIPFDKIGIYVDEYRKTK